MTKTGQLMKDQRYSLWSNVNYVIALLWRWGRIVFPLTVLAAVSEVFTPFIAIFLPKMVIDALSTGMSVGDLLRMIAGVTLLLAVLEVGKAVASQFLKIESVYNRIRYMILAEEKSMSMDFDHIEDPAGQTVKQKAYEALISNSSGAEAMVLNLANLCAHSLGLLLYCTVVATLNWWIVILMLAGSGISIAAMRYAQLHEATLRDGVAEANKKNRYLATQANDYLNAKDIRLYNMAPWLYDLIDKTVLSLASLRRRIHFRYFAAESTDSLISFIRDGLAYAYLIGMVVSDSLSVGDFTLLFAAISGISVWIMKITNDINLILAASLELGFFRSFLSLEDKPRPELENLQISSAPEICFEHVSFRYPGSEQWILRNFNLHIKSGEKVALVGVTGAGKTTCVKLLTGLYRPTEGRILIDGHDSLSFPREELFRIFAPVFQEVRVLAMDLKRNVALLPPEEIDSQRVIACLEASGLGPRYQEMKLGLDTQLTRFLDPEGIDLSGGQAQRLMLARALYKDAPVVIMDEPTSALDALAEAELYQHYDEIVGMKTSLYISHRLASTRFCDRIVFLSNGKVAETGSHDDLIKAGGLYAEMFAVQSHYYQEEIAPGTLEIAQIVMGFNGGS
ncbi:MAG: ABC transporter ATP-binding protein/permease [Symbiobacteriaceae bacterium]|nr:ABC transporter ATP-binding protein/permease [Symbiobacteriaceae bacterium]